MKLRGAALAAGLFLPVLVLPLQAPSGAAAPSAAESEFVYLQPEDIEYQTAAGSGLRQAVLAGNPAEPGLYVIRIEFPPGVTSPPHFHNQDRYITVISGVWSFGMGASGNCDETVPLPQGSFAVHPKGAVHFDGACGDESVTVEIRGIGPVKTTGL